MAIDVVSKLDDRIRKLQVLREIASDPELAEMLAEMFSSNGHRPGHGITVAVQRACSELHGRFTIRDVKKRLIQSGFSVTAKNPTVAIGGVLRKLADPKRKVLKIVEQARGRKPKVYEFIKDSAKASAE